jgi:hypothetical protein
MSLHSVTRLSNNFIDAAAGSAAAFPHPLSQRLRLYRLGNGSTLGVVSIGLWQRSPRSSARSETSVFGPRFQDRKRRQTLKSRKTGESCFPVEQHPTAG